MAAQVGVLFNHYHLLAQVGCTERGGVTAGACAKDEYFGVDVAFNEGCRIQDTGFRRRWSNGFFLILDP